MNKGRLSHTTDGRVSQKAWPHKPWAGSQKGGSHAFNKGRVSQEEGFDRRQGLTKGKVLPEGKVSQKARSHRRQGFPQEAGLTSDRWQSHRRQGPTAAHRR